MPNPIPMIPGVLLSAASVAYYTVPVQDQKLRQAELVSLRFVNHDVAARTVTVHVVQPGDTPSNANVRFKGLSVPPASGGAPPPFFKMHDVLLPGASIYAKADSPGVVSISANGISYP